MEMNQILNVSRVFYNKGFTFQALYWMVDTGDLAYVGNLCLNLISFQAPFVFVKSNLLFKSFLNTNSFMSICVTNVSVRNLCIVKEALLRMKVEREYN